MVAGRVIAIAAIGRAAASALWMVVATASGRTNAMAADVATFVVPEAAMVIYFHLPYCHPAAAANAVAFMPPCLLVLVLLLLVLVLMLSLWTLPRGAH